MIPGKKILVSDKVHPLLVNGLKESGFTVDYHPKMPYDEVKSNVNSYNGIIINSKVICDKDFLDQVTHLDFIGRLGSGLDIIDLPYAASRGIKIISSPEGNANAVAEHAMAMLLGLINNINRSHNSIREFQWDREPNRGEELLGKTIGLIGYGHTGPALAGKLTGYDVRVLAYDKYRKDYNGDNQVEEASMDHLLKESDIVSIHLPLTAETNNLVDLDFLSKCKHGTIIINTSRGKILDSEALLQNIESGHIKGACLDVIENEKPDTWDSNEHRVYGALLKRDDVVITPHIAGWTHRSLELIASIILRKIRTHYKLQA